MPKARRRKDSSFEPSQVKSVFLYGKPNQARLAMLTKCQRAYQDLANRDILILSETAGITMQLVKNDRSPPKCASWEKPCAPQGTIPLSARMPLTLR